jgi:2-iminobutanoate/2-iminopropanoate deaminase
MVARTNTGEIIADDVAAATIQCLENMEAVLRTRGLDRRSVVKLTVYLVDFADYGAMNRAFEVFFSGTYPARTTIQAGGLGLGTVELDAVAYAGA